MSFVPSKDTVYNVKKYDYLNYEPSQLYKALEETIESEKEMNRDMLSTMCKDQPYYWYYNPLFYDTLKLQGYSRKLLGMYMKCKINTIKKYAKLNNSDKIDSWNAIFSKIAGINVTAIASGANGVISRGLCDYQNLIIKSGKNIRKSNELIHEYTIGLYLNKLYTVSDNFPLMYGILPSCSIPYVANFDNKKYLLDSCNQAGWFQGLDPNKPRRIGESAHLIMEEIRNSMSLSSLVKLWMSNLDSFDYNDEYLKYRDRVLKDLYTILLQVFCALATAYKHINFVHNDLHEGNIMIEKMPERIMKYQLSNTIIEIKTEYIAKIIDFGFSTITVDCNVLVDGTTLGLTEYKTYASDSLSGVAVPWVDPFRLIGSLTSRYIDDRNSYMMGPNSYENGTRMPLIEAISHIYGLIINYSKDVVKSFKTPSYEDPYYYVATLGAENIIRNKKINPYFLTNSTEDNLPSSECVAFMMLNNSNIRDIISDNVKTYKSESLYNTIPIDLPILKDFAEDNYNAIDDDFDIELASLIEPEKTIMPLIDGSLDQVPMEGRISSFINIFINPRIKIISDTIGDRSADLTKLEHPKDTYMKDYYVNAYRLNDKDYGREYSKYRDIYMLMLDTALIAKTEYELFNSTIKKMKDNDLMNDTVREEFNKLTVMVDEIIAATNTAFQRLPTSLLLLIYEISIRNIENYMIDTYILEDGYSYQTERYYKELLDYINDSLMSGNISDYVVERDGYSFVDITKGLSTNDKKEFVYLLSFIIPNLISDDKVDIANNTSFIFKILTFEPIVGHLK